MLIDSHAHIYGPEFSADLDQILKRAEDAGVAEIVVVGADVESSRAACELVSRYPNLFAAVGVHPHDASDVTEETYDTIRQLALDTPRVVAIGEIGLDFYRDRSPRPLQEEVFRRFIRLDLKEKPQYGIGLGLSLVKTIVEEHGGTVGLDERPGGGSIFWFSIPVRGEKA